jgi:predicted DCC family thiol-disulfide oxidoreductase YuxK
MRAAQLVSYHQTMEQTATRHPFPADLLEGMNGDLIVFDGVCVLCNGFVRFLIKRDKAGRFKFMTAQSKTGEALYARLGKKCGDYETYFFIADGVVYEKFDAVLEVMARMGWPWRAVKPLRLLPLGLKNWLYDRLARNRYELFGKRDQCMVPDASVSALFEE